MALNTELLNCRRLTAGMFFPARQLQANDMNKLYATVTDQYPYQTLQHLPDGIRMANADNDCILQGGQPPNPGRIQVNENNMFHFEPAKQKAMGLFQIVCDHMSIDQFLAFGIKLTAFLPTEGQNAADVIENSAVAGLKPLLDSLGPGRQGTGIRVVIHHNGAHDLRIEPFFADMSQIYVELDVQHPEPFGGLQLVEQRMNSAYRFLNEDVRAMLGKLG